MADPTPKGTPLSPTQYKTLVSAVQAALAQAKAEKVQSNEWAGAVIKNPDGTYQYTVPQQGVESHFDMKLDFPKSALLSALYHTHPAYHSQPSDTLFSPNDVDVANQLKVPSYIYVGYDGKEREYDPGQTPTQYDWSDGGHVSKGTILPDAPPVQQISPIQQALALATKAAQAATGDSAQPLVASAAPPIAAQK